MPESPKWETPKAHQRAQKQRIERAAKAAKEARAAARAAEEAQRAAKARATAQPLANGRPQYLQEELCRSCPIHAPHRIGMYKYDSPDLPKKILIIQGKVVKGTATHGDLMLQNAFAAVHTNSFHVPAPATPAAALSNAGNTAAPTSGPQRNRGRRFQNRNCRDPGCPVMAPHCRGRVHVDSRNVPRKIQTVTDRIANNRAAREEYQLLRDFHAVHNPEVEEEVNFEVDGEAEIIC